MKSCILGFEGLSWTRPYYYLLYYLSSPLLKHMSLALGALSYAERVHQKAHVLMDLYIHNVNTESKIILGHMAQVETCPKLVITTVPKKNPTYKEDCSFICVHITTFLFLKHTLSVTMTT